MKVGEIVLLVEDDPAVRTSTAAILRDAGYEVEEVEDPFVALERLKSGRVGAVLLDVGMETLDGLGILDKLDDPPPIVLVTGHDYDAEVMAHRSKIFSYLQKPVPPPVLIAAVARALSGGPVVNSRDER